MADVFVSYAREDRARADLVAQNLAATGLDVFWDSEIPPGQTWADYVEDKLSKCKVVIVLWSEHSTRSQWVREEARMGRDRGKLIPAMIDASAAPFGFGEVQAANLSTWTGDPNHPDWRRFAAAVAEAAGAPAQPMPARPATFTPPPPGPRPLVSPPPAARGGGVKPIWILGGMGALAVVLAAAFFFSRPGPGPTPPQPAVQELANTTTTPEQQQAAQTDTSPQAIIGRQLANDQQYMTQQGYQMIGQPAQGSLPQGQTASLPAQLVPGVDYKLIGVCDNDCRDLDISVLDATGNVLAQDTAADDHPVVGVTTTTPGNFTINVNMYNCSVAPCFYAVTLYGKRGG